jgi:hypothetical protein
MKSSFQRALGALCLISALFLSACGGDTTACVVDTDCAAGKVCKSGSCLAPGQCDPGVLSCTDTSQCGAQKICSSGCCAPVTGCATSSDCTDAALPHCNASSHVCEKCSSNTQCASGKVCSTSGRCESGCASDTDCKVAGKTKCTTGGYCGECKASSDCTDASKPICGGGVCFGCASNADCGGATPVCNSSSKACVVCLDAQNSGGVNPACTTAGKNACLNQTCVTCIPSANEASGQNGACVATSVSTPACSATATCVACLASANDATTGKNPLCGDAAKPSCDATSVCGCSASAQCEAGKSCDPGTKTCRAPVLVSFAASVTTVVLNGTATLTATLDIATPVAVTIPVTLTGPGSVAPTSITIAANEASGATVYTAPATAGTANVSVTLGAVTKAIDLTITAAPVTLSTFTSDKANLQEGHTATLTATLTAAPASPVTVVLTNDSAALGALSATSTVISGASNSTPITFTAAANASGTATLHAALDSVTKDLSINVFKVQVSSLTGASTASAGAKVQMTVTLAAAPPADASVALSATGGTVPPTVTVLSGATTAVFDFTAGAAGAATVTASSANSTQTANITVTAAAANFMVIRVDGGGAALAATAAAVFIEERKFSDGSLVRTITMPTAVTGSNNPLVLTGNSGTEGGLSRSANGKYVTLGGYSMAVGTASPSGVAAATSPRVAGRIDAAGAVDTSTKFGTQFDKFAIRGVTSSTGGEFWASGSTSSGSGVIYNLYGGATPVVLNTVSPFNNRHIGIFGGNLYVSQATGSFQGVSQVGTGLPTAATTISLLSGFPTAATTPVTMSPATFAMLDTDATLGPDVIYLAQEVTPTVTDSLVVEKWTLTGSTWSKSAMLPKFPTGGGAGGAIGVAVLVDGGVTRVVATTFESSGTVPNRLVTFVDDGSANPVVSVLATSPVASGSATAAFRGLALSPTP